MAIGLDDFLNSGSTPSNNTPVPSSTTPVSLDDFLGPDSSMQNSQQNAPEQPSPGDSGGGFFSNLWNGAVDAGSKVLGTIGNGIQAVEQLPVIHNIAGAFAGAAKPVDSLIQNMQPGSGWQGVANDITSIPKTYYQAVPGAIKGLIHPDQAIQDYQQQISGENGPDKFVANMVADPASYVPLGPILKGIGWGGKLLSDTAGATPYIAKAADATMNNPVSNAFKDIYGTLFKKGSGTSPDTVPTMNGLGNTMSADQYAIMNKMDELKQSHGLTPEQMSEVPHVMDTGIPSQDPAINQAVKELSDTLSGGFNSVHGKVNGTDAELRNSFTNQAPSLQQLFAQNAGSQIRSGAVGDYYPRRFNNTPEEVSAALDQYNGLQKGFSTNGVFNKAREFPTLKDAIDHGLKPEMNPYVAVGQRMGETSKAINTDNAIKQLQYAGVVKNAHEPGMVESTTNPFTSYIKNVTNPKTGEESSFINRSYMNPKDQSYIQRSLDPQGAKTSAENVLDKVAKYSGYDPTINLLKKAALMLSPQVHAHNLIDNGMYLGGAKTSDTLRTMYNLKKGISDPDYERALASGAISTDAKGSAFSDALSKKLSPEDKNIFQKALGVFNYGAHDALWDADKGLRTSINKQAIEGGATDAEAAAKANKFLVDYKNTTPFENAVMKRIFPFYSWMKGNMPLQAEQWINNGPKQMLARNAVNAASQAMSGNDEHNGKVDTGLTASDGSHTMYDPYIASEDPAKLLRDTPIPFLFNRTNPVLKLMMQEMTNKKYSPLPLTAAPDKQYLNKTDIRLPGSAAEDSGYNTRSTIAHIANGLNPFSGGPVGGLVGSTGSDARGYIDRALGVGKKDKYGNDVEKAGATLPELLLPLTGGFTSRFNPNQEDKSKVYQDQQKKKDDISFKKSQGDYVSKSEKRDAYRKVR